MSMSFTTYDTVEALPSEPLWPGYWPRGEVVGWFGMGGLGKGRCIASLISRITQGLPMPFCSEPAKPGSVLVCLPEDHPNEQVRPRLDAEGADPKHVIDITRLEGGERFKLSALATKKGDVGRLREAIETLKLTCWSCRVEFRNGKCPECSGTEHMNPRLVVIDPLMAVVGWGSISTVAGARRVIEPLQDVAQSTGVTILLVMHATKGGVLQGSAGIQQALRLLYKVELDTNPLIRVISLEKSNNQGDTPTVKFTIESGDDGKVRVVWLSRDEQDQRAKSWREIPPKAPGASANSVAGGRYSAAVTVNGTTEGLGEYDKESWAFLACTSHPLYVEGTKWMTGASGRSSRLRDGDGNIVIFHIADNQGRAS